VNKKKQKTLFIRAVPVSAPQTGAPLSIEKAATFFVPIAPAWRSPAPDPPPGPWPGQPNLATQ
jgi:hypothetical protein